MKEIKNENLFEDNVSVLLMIHKLVFIQKKLVAKFTVIITLVYSNVC